MFVCIGHDWMLNHVGGLMMCLLMFGQSYTKHLECLRVVRQRPSFDNDSLSRFQFTVNPWHNRPQIIMATENFTDDGQQETSEQLLCSPDITKFHRWTFISVNCFLSVTAFLGNALILIALQKESSLQPPSKLLFRCLATTDLCVGLISQPLAVTYWMSIMNEYWKTCRYLYKAVFTVGHLLSGVSVLTLTAISVDRLLALLLGLRHRQVVTLKRTCVIVITFWIVSAAFSAMKWCSDRITIWYSIIGTLVCLMTSIFSYTKIFLTLRLHQNHVQDHVQQPNQTNQLNIARYKKAVSTVTWLQLTLVVCYLPHGVAAFVTSGGPSAPVYNAWYYTVTLVFLNSSLNPILYCWKIKEVRQAVKNIIRQVLCHCFTC